MRVLIVGSNALQNGVLAREIQAAAPPSDTTDALVKSVTTIQEARRCLRRNRVQVVVITESSEYTVGLAAGLVPLTFTHGSVLDTVMLVNYESDVFGPPPMGVDRYYTYDGTNTELVAAVVESLAEAQEYNFRSGIGD